MASTKPVVFVTLDTDCMVCVSHKHNADGYFHKSWGSQSGGNRIMEMFHRYIFRAHHGLEEIPDGHEIDHKCGNRACCNPSHLRLLGRTEHLVHTNQTRWLPKVWRLAA